MYDYLLALIPKGKENAVSNEALQGLLHQTRREVSQTIHDARMDGMIICSGNQGYYIPETDAELLEGYDTLWSMSISVLASLKTMRKEIVRRDLLKDTREKSKRKGRSKSDEERKKSSTHIQKLEAIIR